MSEPRKEKIHLEASSPASKPKPDVRPKIEEPPPGRLVSIEDSQLWAGAGLERELDDFYVGLLKFERQQAENEIVYRAENLRQSASAASADAFGQALARELRRRSDLFLRGIERYRHHSYRRAMPEMPPLWEEGTTRLLDYAPGGGAPVLVVPSLIN